MSGSNKNFNDQATGFSEINAYWSAVASKLAYESKAGIRKQFSEWGFEDFKFLNNEKTGTQGYIAGNDRMLMLAFRGTEGKIKDILTDADLFLTVGPAGEVHNGFLRGLRSIWGDLCDFLDTERGDRSLWVTGHSLGAALATLAVAKLHFEKNMPVNGLYTFGQPRVGDEVFASEFNNDLKSKAFRYVNNNDIVTRIPPESIGYDHVGTFRYFDKDGNQQDDLDWWDRFLDRIGGRIDDLFVPGTDGIKDHSVDNYVRCTENAATV